MDAGLGQEIGEEIPTQLFRALHIRSALPPAEGKSLIFTTRHGKEVASVAEGQKGTDTLTDVWNKGEIKEANE